jgi:hypothetical protein
MSIFIFRFTPKDDVKPYNIYGVTVGEVEVDLLTGQHQVSRIIGKADRKECKPNCTVFWYWCIQKF